MKWMPGLSVLALLAWSVAAHAEAPKGDLNGNDKPAVATAQDLAASRDAQQAYGSHTKGPYYYASENELRARKLARGVANVTLCVGEVPNQMFREAFKTSPVSGAFVGLFKGVKKGAQRLAIGTWEIATFYLPGTNHYQPYVEPEVVFEEENH